MVSSSGLSSVYSSSPSTRTSNTTVTSISPSGSDPPSNDLSKSPRKLPIGGIIGGVIGGIVVVAIAVAIVCARRRRRRQRDFSNKIQEKATFPSSSDADGMFLHLNIYIQCLTCEGWWAHVEDGMAKPAIGFERASYKRPGGPDSNDTHPIGYQSSYLKENEATGYQTDMLSTMPTAVKLYDEDERGSLDMHISSHSHEGYESESTTSEDVTLGSGEGPWGHSDEFETSRNVTPAIDIENMDLAERERRRDALLEQMRRVLDKDRKAKFVVL